MKPETVVLNGHRIRINGGYRRYGASRVKTCARFLDQHWIKMHDLSEKFHTTFQEVHDLALEVGLKTVEAELKKLPKGGQ